MKKLLAIGLSAMMLASSLAVSVPADEAGDFDWKKFDGEEITVLFSEHTYADAVEQKLDEFTEKTGIKVNYSSMPEGNYFEKLNVELSSHSGSIDVFMTGAYQSWEYATAGNLEPLENFIDTDLTSPEWKYDDFIPAVIDALKWDCVPGHAVGEGSQWALPMGWEVNILTYNKKILEEKGLPVPETAEQLLEDAKALNEFNGSGTYGLAVRGLPDWGTIHPAYMSLYSTWGAKDFEIEDGKLVSQVNSPEAVAMTEYWVDLVKNGGAPQWATYGWEMCGADLGAGKAAMMWDADRGGYTQNVEGASAEAGNFAFGMVPYPESAGKTTSPAPSSCSGPAQTQPAQILLVHPYLRAMLTKSLLQMQKDIMKHSPPFPQTPASSSPLSRTSQRQRLNGQRPFRNL